jgi:anaerobic magnesium-protoporphyrin IX monomethyl ester cyclase
MHQGIRHRDPAKIVEEMVWVKSTFGHDTFFFQDDVSFLVREQLEGFLDELEKCGEKLYWYYEAREDILLDFRDLWERMKRNGLFKIVVGLESPDPVQRERMGKSGYDLGAVDSMLQTLEKDLDIMVSVYLLFGILEDTEESMDALLQYARHLYPDYCSFVVGSIAVPYPGTSKFIELKEKDLLSTYDWSDYGFSTSVIKASFSSQKLQDIFSGFWVGTYVRPKALLKQVELLLSRNRFRRAMAKQYITMAVEMISDVEKMKGERKDGF